jgi:uncharacterized protein
MSSGKPPAESTAGDLLDVNVWLALAIDEHPHHPAALRYWSGNANIRKLFCRLSAMGFVRLLTQPRLMAEGALDLAEAWTLYERYVSMPRVALLPEPDGVDAQLSGFVAKRLPARLLTDAYLASVSACAGLRLVTFDKDFERFAGLALFRLSANQ